MAVYTAENLPSKIRVLEVVKVEDFGKEKYKNSVEAYYETIVRWCKPGIDKHVAEADPESFIFEDKISIETWSRNHIESGIYISVPGDPKAFALEEPQKQDAA